MKFAKLAGTAAMVIAVLAVFAGPAAATVVTSNGKTYTGTLAGSNDKGHVSLHGSNGITIECSLSLEGTVEKHGSSVTAEGAYSQVSFPNCTNSYVVHTLSIGRVVAHSNGNGTAAITSVGTKAEVTAPTIFGTLSCVYDTGAGTQIGTLTDSSKTGGKATIDFQATIPRTGGSSLCGNTGVITGNGIVDTPSNLTID